MKIGPLMIGKDGGPESNVDGFLFEIKSLFSVGILRFKDGSRDAFHSHAFNCWSWLFYGYLVEAFLDTNDPRHSTRHKAPKFITTKRTDIHKVYSCGTSYVLTFRGPWKKTWIDVIEDDFGGWIVDRLTNNRQIVDTTVFGSRNQVLRDPQTSRRLR